MRRKQTIGSDSDEIFALKREIDSLRAKLIDAEKRAKIAEDRASKFDRTGETGRRRAERGDWLTHYLRLFLKKTM